MDDICRNYAANICEHSICARRSDDLMATSLCRAPAREPDGRRGARATYWCASRKLDTVRSGLEYRNSARVYASCGVALQAQD